MKMFQSKEQILTLIEEADNSNDTKRLTAKFKALKKSRSPFFLTKDDLEEILYWKLRQQYGRQRKRRLQNTGQNIRIITKSAFAVNHKDFQFETKLRLKILTALEGVAIPVASAILTLCYPNTYSVIDFRNWRQIFPKLADRNGKTTYSINEYILYLDKIKELAKNYEVSPQQIDIAIWQKDIEQNRR